MTNQTSGTGMGADEWGLCALIESYGDARAGYATCQDRCVGDGEWRDAEDQVAQATSAVRQALADHAADPGARRDRVAEAAMALVNSCHDFSASGDSAFVGTNEYEALRDALAAPDQSAGPEMEEEESTGTASGYAVGVGRAAADLARAAAPETQP